LAAGSCGPSLQYTGLYEGDRNVSAPPGEDPAIAKTLSMVKLDLMGAGRFTLLDMGIPKGGSYRESGGKLYLKIDMIMERPLSQNPDLMPMHERELILEPKNGGMELLDPNLGDNRPIMLKKRPQP
jgi:hypothetical protein